MASVFLIGDPVAHSLSPAMQNAAFAALGLPHRYELLRTEEGDLPATIARLRGEDVLGANVTIPHKERVARLLDATEEEALRIGAVNTIFKRAGALRGDNTDGIGFAAALAERGLEVAGRRVLVLGAGGAARACVGQLLRAGASVAIANRTPSRAQAVRAAMRDLPAATGDALSVAAWPGPDALARYDVLVNATALGMHGEDVLPGVPLREGLAVVDVVAIAAETPLIAHARALGRVAVDGLLMLLHQGAQAFRLWTGVDAPLTAMRATLPRPV